MRAVRLVPRHPLPGILAGRAFGRLVPLGSHCVSAPWGGTLSTTKDVHSDVSVDARQKLLAMQAAQELFSPFKLVGYWNMGFPEQWVYAPAVLWPFGVSQLIL